LSKGTYIRVLGEDIAQALGTYGHLIYLHRIQTGHFELDPSYTIEYLESLTEQQREALLLPFMHQSTISPKFKYQKGVENILAVVWKVILSMKLMQKY
jgi:tRNA pseudouridine55 synthase